MIHCVFKNIPNRGYVYDGPEMYDQRIVRFASNSASINAGETRSPLHVSTNKHETGDRVFASSANEVESRRRRNRSSPIGSESPKDPGEWFANNG